MSQALCVCLLSDTHGTLDARIAAVAACCHYVVHAGDIGAASVLAALQPHAGRVLAVRGNNDTASKWPADEHAILETLPLTGTLDLPAGRLAVEHGHMAGSVAQRHDNLRRRHLGARLVVYGHSHRLVCDMSVPVWVVNPGAAGRARTHGGPSCVLLHITDTDWRLEPRRFQPLPLAA